MRQKGFVQILIIIFITTILCGVVYLGIKQAKNNVSPSKSPTASPTPTATADPTANWKTYTNTKYGFSFKYPIEWKTRSFAGSQEPIDTTLSFSLETMNSDSRATVSLDLNQFGLNHLKKYAPTGSEDILPTQKQLGGNIFYYYGAGGGGVNYADQYFYNLNGKILIFNFNGPYGDNNKSPSKQTQIYEDQILSTFKFIN